MKKYVCESELTGGFFVWQCWSQDFVLWESYRALCLDISHTSGQSPQSEIERFFPGLQRWTSRCKSCSTPSHSDSMKSPMCTARFLFWGNESRNDGGMCPFPATYTFVGNGTDKVYDINKIKNYSANMTLNQLTIAPFKKLGCGVQRCLTTPRRNRRPLILRLNPSGSKSIATCRSVYNL